MDLSLNNTKLPAKVQSHQVQMQSSHEIRRAVFEVQKAVLSLREIEELQPYMVESLEGFTPDWISKTVDPAIAAIESDPGLTVDERSARLQVWQKEIRKDAESLVDIIRSELSKWPKLTWSYDPNDGAVTVNFEQIEAIADELATFDVPAAAHKHWERLQSIIADIKNLRAWECEQGVYPVLIGSAVNCSPYLFAEQWASGANRIPERFKKYNKQQKGLLI